MSAASVTVLDRETFDCWAQPTPTGDWSYVLDCDNSIWRPGLWPFGSPEAHGGRRFANEVGDPTTVRLSPDCDYRSWRNEYVLLGPVYLERGPHNELRTDPRQARTHLTLFVRDYGRMGGMVVRNVKVELDLLERTWTVDPHCPEVVREQAERKADLLSRFVVEARRRRRAGEPHPGPVASPERAQARREGLLAALL